MTATALLLIVMAVVLVRLGWGGARPLTLAGWALGAAMLIWLGWRDGAWGVAVGFVAGIGAALAILLHAAAISPPKARAGRASGAAAVVRHGPVAIGRRFAVFLAVVPLAFVAAQWFAFAVNAAMKGDGALDANSVAVMLFVQPIVWAILMGWQMTMGHIRAMLVPPLVAAALGLVLWGLA